MYKGLFILMTFCGFVLLSNLSSAQEQPKKENLGFVINTPHKEILPVISPDGQTLYFCRWGNKDNLGDENDQDIWVSIIDSNGEWSRPRNIGFPLNNYGSNGVCSVSPDGNTLLLFGVYQPDSTIQAGVSISHKTANNWSYPEKLNIKNFANLSLYASYYLANDGKTLLMCIEGAETYGGLDVYVSFKEDGNTWTEPKNLGKTINTPFDDYSPFLASDGVSLYFSSVGHGGFGKADIFVSRRLDSTWLNWTSPENLGETINTTGNDAYYMMPASGDYAYFSSAVDMFGDMDIFRIKVPKDVQPRVAVIISGKVLNSKTGQPIDAQVYYEVLPSG